MFFEITNNKIIQKNIKENQMDCINTKTCCFHFTTKEWLNKEKYIIFWGKNNKTIIHSIGKKCKTKIKIPEAIDPNNFTIEIYINDNIKTEKYTIGELIQPNEKQDCVKKQAIDLTNKFYEQLNKKIDNVLFSDNTFYFYANDELIKTINLEKMSVDERLSLTSFAPVANKTITEALSKKIDSSDISDVAKTGEYNDLKNKPTEFHPSRHMHTKDDLINFDYNVDEDIEIILIKLTDDILGM